MSVVLIVDSFFSKCSACNGNADPSEHQHVHGGPGSGYREGSALSDTNGCGATFTERYIVSACRTEPIQPGDVQCDPCGAFSTGTTFCEVCGIDYCEGCEEFHAAVHPEVARAQRSAEERT